MDKELLFPTSTSTSSKAVSRPAFGRLHIFEVVTVKSRHASLCPMLWDTSRGWWSVVSATQVPGMKNGVCGGPLESKPLSLEEEALVMNRPHLSATLATTVLSSLSL